MPKLLKAVAGVPSGLNTWLAGYWLLLTPSRTAEIRFATWDEIEDGKHWRAPAERMKMSCERVVPLAMQAQQVSKHAAALRTSPDDADRLFPGCCRCRPL